MKGNLKIYEKLPFAASFKRKMSKTLTVRKVNSILGSTYYPRLTAIYQNMLEAVTYANFGYIRKNAVPELATQLVKRRDYHKNLGVKLKINEPTKKLQYLKNFFMPERAYRTDNFYITVSSRVYFGSELAQLSSYSPPEYIKKWRIGANRFLLWNSNMSLAQNIKNWYNHQVYQFIVAYQSNIFIKCQDSHNGNLYNSKNKSKLIPEINEDTIVTEFVLRTGNDKFDWLLADVNGILQGHKWDS